MFILVGEVGGVFLTIWGLGLRRGEGEGGLPGCPV